MSMFVNWLAWHSYFALFYVWKLLFNTYKRTYVQTNDKQYAFADIVRLPRRLYESPIYIILWWERVKYDAWSACYCVRNCVCVVVDPVSKLICCRIWHNNEADNKLWLVLQLTCKLAIHNIWLTYAFIVSFRWDHIALSLPRSNSPRLNNSSQNSAHSYNLIVY